MRLDSCNFRRDNLALTNSKNDLSKLISLIATNQIPRVGVFLNVLLNQGHGINTVIEKFYQAVNKVHQCCPFIILQEEINLVLNYNFKNFKR